MPLYTYMQAAQIGWATHGTLEAYWLVLGTFETRYFHFNLTLEIFLKIILKKYLYLRIP